MMGLLAAPRPANEQDIRSFRETEELRQDTRGRGTPSSLQDAGPVSHDVSAADARRDRDPGDPSLQQQVTRPSLPRDSGSNNVRSPSGTTRLYERPRWVGAHLCGRRIASAPTYTRRRAILVSRWTHRFSPLWRRHLRRKRRWLGRALRWTRLFSGLVTRW